MREKATTGVVDATAIISRNSVDYVAALFRHFERDEAIIAIKSSEDLTRLQGVSVAQIYRPGMRAGWFDECHGTNDSETVALVSFTSGTTGGPKGVMLSHAGLADTVARIIAISNIDASIREYVGVPATGSFGFGRFRACAAVGGRAYLPPRGFDLREFIDMLEGGQVNALSAVPTLLRVLLANPEAMSGAGEGLRWLEIGSQHMAGAEKQKLRSIFPNAQIIQHYGLTEASRATFLDISLADGARLDSVGRAIGSTEVAISEDGRIRIRGPHVAHSWVGPQGIRRLVDSDGWLTTSDLGRIDGGDLYYEGRCDDQINCGGIKINPDLLEDRLRGQLKVPGGIGVARTFDSLRGEGIIVATDLPDLELSALRAAAQSELDDLGLRLHQGLHIICVDQLPTTATGKLQRNVLGNLCSKATGPEADLNADRLDFTTTQVSFPDHAIDDVVREAISSVMPGSLLLPDQTLEDVTADSMNTLMLVMELERLLKRKVPFDIMQPDTTLRELGLLLATPSLSSAHLHPARVFLFPGLFGDEPALVGFRREAADRLNLELIEIPDLEESSVVLSDMSAMGAIAAHDIAERQPDGPLILAGYSFGGIVAWAAAESLRSSGRTIALLILLDSSSEDQLFVDRSSTQRHFIPLRLRQRTRRYKPRRSESFKHYTMRVLLNLIQEIRAFDVARRLIVRWRWSMPARLMRDQRRQVLRYYRNLALSSWQRRPLQAKILLVESEGSASNGLTAGWRRENSKLEVFRLPGGHRDLFDILQLSLLIPKLVRATLASHEIDESDGAISSNDLLRSTNVRGVSLDDSRGRPDAEFHDDHASKPQIDSPSIR